MTGDLGWPLERAARLYGGEVAVVDGERSVTYAELARRAGAIGAALDVEPGGRVGYLGANSLAHLECWLAVPASGRVLVDLNYRLAPDELAFMAEDAGIEVLIADDERIDSRGGSARASSRSTSGRRSRPALPRLLQGSTPPRSPRSPTPAARPGGRRA